MKRRRARLETGRGRNTAAARTARKTSTGRAKDKRAAQEQRWARMAGPVTVRRFDPETGEAIDE